jgi:uncharacterized protein YecT (DUF1311 family)
MTMKRSPPCLLLALTLLSAAPALAAGPGFDCAKATRQIDKAICAWEMVSVLDGRMADAFKATLAAQKGEAAVALVKANQKAWLAERDHRCGLDNVTPREGSEDGLSPKEFGQLMCFQAIYPERIAQLMDLTAPPLVPLDVRTVPTEPLQAAYPDDWQQAGYQALFSPDKALMALGIEDSAGYVMQVWLYQPTSERLAMASPRTHEGKVEKPEDIAELNSWFWRKDGRFYVRARRPLGQDSLFAADMDGYAEVGAPPADVAEKFTAGEAPRQNSETLEADRPPGFDDDSYNEQEGGAFTAWAQNRGHGSFELLAARAGDEEPRLIASGGWEVRNFQFDPSGTRLFYNGENGLVVTDPESVTTRRLRGTHGMTAEVRPITLSADGDILVYWAVGSCTDDAADGIDPNIGDDSARRVCLTYLPVAAATSIPVSETTPAKAGAAPTDPWVGEWADSGGGELSAIIRRGTAKPDYLVIELATGALGCSGAVTLYGKPRGRTVLGESYDPGDPSAPVCRVELSLGGEGELMAEAVGPCTYYHGASCGFDGSLTRGQ